jgi:hypothetical protein
MPTWIIYCHTHVATGRRYIGLTRMTMMKRWNRHVYDATRRQGPGYFPNAIRKYGKDAFEHFEFPVRYSTLDEANRAEAFAIEFFCTRDPAFGFNIAKGGSIYVPHLIKNPWDRPEYRALRVRQINWSWQDPAYVALNRTNNKAALNTPESRAKRAEISRRVLSDPDVKIRMSAANSGRVFSTVHRANLSLANERRAQDPVFAAKNKAQLDAVRPSPPSSVGRVHCQETKSKISSALSGRAPSSLAIENSVKSRREKAAAKAYFLCKKHGPVSFTDCFQRKDNAGRVRYECKECKRTDNRARKLA